jgi:hypothetical protein
VEARVRIHQLQKQAEAEIRHRDRRERIATAALQGLMADESHGDTTFPRLAKIAVKAADALIAELDKPKEVQP